jgi:excisionase family DNA binding protein
MEAAKNERMLVQLSASELDERIEAALVRVLQRQGAAANDPEQPEYLKTKEAAKLLKMSTRHVHNMISKEDLPYHKAGHALRFKRSELMEWMAKRGRQGG